MNNKQMEEVNLVKTFNTRWWKKNKKIKETSNIKDVWIINEFCIPYNFRKYLTALELN